MNTNENVPLKCRLTDIEVVEVWAKQQWVAESTEQMKVFGSTEEVCNTLCGIVEAQDNLSFFIETFQMIILMNVFDYFMKFRM